MLVRQGVAVRDNSTGVFLQWGGTARFQSPASVTANQVGVFCQGPLSGVVGNTSGVVGHAFGDVVSCDPFQRRS